jgi:AcrR family transcriptional regulator
MSAMTAAPRTRERIVEAAVAMTTESGWSAVTMGTLAQRVGVSRQTVYNELGSKEGLAEAVILSELERFLAAVSAAFDAHPDVLVDAIRAATYAVLEHARDNKLLHAVVSATHGADTELLPLLTTHAESLLAAAKAVVTERVVPYDPGLEGPQLDVAIDVVVRVVLSHVMQPSGSPAETADGIAWLAGRALRG